MTTKKRPRKKSAPVMSLAALLALLLLMTPLHAADAPTPTLARTANPTESAIANQFKAYVETFNRHDAAALGNFWTEDGVSIHQDSGDRAVGREALVKDFESFFQQVPDIQLSGTISNVTFVRPDVVSVTGQTVLTSQGETVGEASFSAVLVQEGDRWLISSSHEHSNSGSATASNPLEALDWLVGTWKDQSDEVQVTTNVRWSPNRAFLIRSFHASHSNGEREGVEAQGTQVIGWDPQSEQIRTWTFLSNGSFGEGTISRSNDEWILRLKQVLSDGSTSAATQVITRVDDNTITVQTIGQTVNGEPLPGSAPVTVVRITDHEPQASQQGGQK